MSKKRVVEERFRTVRDEAGEPTQVPLDGQYIAVRNEPGSPDHWWVLDLADEHRRVFCLPGKFPPDFIVHALLAWMRGRDEGLRQGDAQRLDAVHKALQLGAYAPQQTND